MGGGEKDQPSLLHGAHPDAAGEKRVTAPGCGAGRGGVVMTRDPVLAAAGGNRSRGSAGRGMP